MNQLFWAKFAIVLAIITILSAACSSNGTVANSPLETPTEPPFANDEPERYQTYIIQRNPAETVRFFVVRDGNRWRIDSAHGTPMQTAALHNEKDYIIAVAARTYAEYDSSHGYDERPNMVQEITHGMINNRENAVYEKIDEVGGLVRYKFLDPRGRESIITYDESKGLPVRKEVFNLKDGVMTQEAVIELEGFSLEVQASHFDLPKDFKRVSPQEMKGILTGK